MTLEELVDLGATMREAQQDRVGNNNAANRAAATVAEKLFDRAIARYQAEQDLRRADQPCVLPEPREISLSVEDTLEATPRAEAERPGRPTARPRPRAEEPPWAQ